MYLDSTGESSVACTNSYNQIKQPQQRNMKYHHLQHRHSIAFDGGVLG